MRLFTAFVGAGTPRFSVQLPFAREALPRGQLSNLVRGMVDGVTGVCRCFTTPAAQYTLFSVSRGRSRV